ncbi:MAG: AI-2E family transporter [Candidatus Levyibacteriota bacterium]|nr:MAG: AI-2E family transporter [Candidatus Levybacteria bacterium]
MTIRLRTAFFIVLGILLLWFLYLEREILTPFVLAGIFAYVFNPIVNFLSHKIRLPRILSIIIIYAIIIGCIVTIAIALTSRVLEESSQLTGYVHDVTIQIEEQIKTLPDWIAPAAKDALISIRKSMLFSPEYLLTLFPQAISRIVSFILFLFSGFFFLKEGAGMFEKALTFVPNDYKIEVEILFRRINAVLNGYLRGQIFMVFLVSLILFIALSVLGVKFALILAIFSGIAEIVPIVGPIVATSIAALITFFSGTGNFAFSPLQGAIVVVIVYTVTRQLQDYFVIPYILGRITKLHPLVILFSVLAGEHLIGPLGLILAVPIAATLKILLEYSIDKVNDRASIKKS